MKPNNLRTISAVILALLSVGARNALAQERRMMDFDSPDVSVQNPTDGQKALERGPVINIGQGREPLSTAATASPSRVWISHSDSTSGCCALAMSMGPEAAVNKPSKVEMNVARGDATEEPDLLLQDGRPHIISFDFKETNQYQNASQWVLHFQVWQRAPFQPPLAMVAIPGQQPNAPGTNYVLITRTDQNLPKPRVWNNGNILPLENGHRFFTLMKGRWYKLELMLLPHPAGLHDGRTGRIVMWIDGTQVADYHGDWGYRHLPSDTPGYFVKLGIYRAGQESTQTVLFDNIVWRSSPRPNEEDQ